MVHEINTQVLYSTYTYRFESPITPCLLVFVSVTHNVPILIFDVYNCTTRFEGVAGENVTPFCSKFSHTLNDVLLFYLREGDTPPLGTTLSSTSVHLHTQHKREICSILYTYFTRTHARTHARTHTHTHTHTQTGELTKFALEVQILTLHTVCMHVH